MKGNKMLTTDGGEHNRNMWNMWLDKVLSGICQEKMKKGGRKSDT